MGGYLVCECMSVYLGVWVCVGMCVGKCGGVRVVMWV